MFVYLNFSFWCLSVLQWLVVDKFQLTLYFFLTIFLKACQILLSGDHSEWNALIEAEENIADDFVCDRYLTQAANIFAAGCTRGTLMFE